MKGFNTSVIHLNTNKLDHSFPDTFTNNLFFSIGKTPKDYTGYNYVSNFAFKYVIEGSESFIVDDKTVHINSNESLLINDGTDTTFIGENGKAISIFIDPDIINDIHSVLENENRAIDYGFNQDPLSIRLYDKPIKLKLPRVEFLKQELLNKSNPVISIDFYYEFANELIQFNNSLFSRINKLDSIKISTKTELFRRVQLAKEYLLDNLYGSFDLDELSKISYLSKYHLIRSFKQIYGITPHKFFIQQKIHAAKNHYVKSKYRESISSLASIFNYPDSSTFSKQFKAVLGYSPSQMSPHKCTKALASYNAMQLASIDVS